MLSVYVEIPCSFPALFPFFKLEKGRERGKTIALRAVFLYNQR
jgi:hypothetical protein